MKRILSVMVLILFIMSNVLVAKPAEKTKDMKKEPVKQEKVKDTKLSGKENAMQRGKGEKKGLFKEKKGKKEQKELKEGKEKPDKEKEKKGKEDKPTKDNKED